MSTVGKRKNRSVLLWKLLPMLAAMLVVVAAKGYEVLAAREASAPSPVLTEAPEHGDLDLPPVQSPPPTPAPTQAAPAYDFSAPVPESAAVDAHWFDDALFIGNSLTEGFILYSGIENAHALTSPGVMVDTIFTAPVINVSGRKLPIMQAAAGTGFNKIYIMLGTNELGWRSLDIFTAKYGAIIDELRRTHPKAEIYVQSILPVTPKLSDNDPVFTNSNVRKFNAAIQSLCAEKEVYYVNVYEAVEQNGVLPEADAYDGVHLLTPGYEKWLTYLKTHTA